MSPGEARRILAGAELLCSATEVNRAIARVAAEINQRLGESNPLMLPVMNGAVFFAGQLLPHLDFPLEQGFLHVTRYANTTSGGKLEWLGEPEERLIAGREVLVVDDILDEGVTLAAIRERLLARGATACHTAVLVAKDIGRERPIKADFVGLTLPNRYIFGCGMDVHGAWRNLPALYAFNE
jgi:hypoxanthine phosphoribosyltransferase